MPEEVRFWRVEPVTPLHIGSGREYDRWGFVTEGLRIKIVDTDALLEEHSQNAYLLNNFATDTHRDLSELIRRANIKPSALPVLYEVPATMTSGISSIREFLRTGDKLLVPGSSLKGAIRTAILWKLLKEEPGFQRNLLNLQPKEVSKQLNKLFHRAKRKT
ncbi:MAG: type III-A CRISPR-associated RAMP protein Csm5, partial [Nitrospirae bacterium]